MIKTKIFQTYPSHYHRYSVANEDLFLADYSEQTKNDLVSRSVEVFPGSPPTDIDYFSIINTPRLAIGNIVFDNSSFTYSSGNARSQCDCFMVPDTSVKNSWLFFLELKYSHLPLNNSNNLIKAKRQLFKTRCYYFINKVFDLNSNCYLIASLPKQREPFAYSSLSPAYLLNLKRKHNIILRFKNSAEIIDSERLNV